MAFNKDQWKKDIDANGNDVYENAWWAFSVLSDAQELIAMGTTKEVSEKINDAKKILLGKYDIEENRRCILIRNK